MQLRRRLDAYNWQKLLLSPKMTGVLRKGNSAYASKCAPVVCMHLIQLYVNLQVGTLCAGLWKGLKSGAEIKSVHVPWRRQLINRTWSGLDYFLRSALAEGDITDLHKKRSGAAGGPHCSSQTYDKLTGRRESLKDLQVCVSRVTSVWTCLRILSHILFMCNAPKLTEFASIRVSEEICCVHTCTRGKLKSLCCFNRAAGQLWWAGKQGSIFDHHTETLASDVQCTIIQRHRKLTES